MDVLRSQIKWLAPLALATLFVACGDGGGAARDKGDLVTAPGLSPQNTASSGFSTTVYGRATFTQDGNNFKVKRITGDWHVEVKAHPAFDIQMQRIDFQPGGHSGWHSHPGPVFIQVVSGTVTFYEADDPTCTPIVKHVGETLVDAANDHGHIARNETTSPAATNVTVFGPPGASLRVDLPNPGYCPF